MVSLNWLQIYGGFWENMGTWVYVFARIWGFYDGHRGSKLLKMTKYTTFGHFKRIFTSKKLTRHDTSSFIQNKEKISSWTYPCYRHANQSSIYIFHVRFILLTSGSNHWLLWLFARDQRIWLEPRRFYYLGGRVFSCWSWRHNGRFIQLSWHRWLRYTLWKWRR